MHFGNNYTMCFSSPFKIGLSDPEVCLKLLLDCVTVYALCLIGLLLVTPQCYCTSAISCKYNIIIKNDGQDYEKRTYY